MYTSARDAAEGGFSQPCLQILAAFSFPLRARGSRLFLRYGGLRLRHHPECLYQVKAHEALLLGGNTQSLPCPELSYRVQVFGVFGVCVQLV